MVRRTPLSWMFLALALVLLPVAGPVLATVEEFESWRFDLLETDDEYALDQLANLFPRRWEESWRNARRGVRLTSGCASYEKWEMNTQIMLSHELQGPFAFQYFYERIETLAYQSVRNELSFSYLHPSGLNAGFLYRPDFDKDFHDLGLFLGWAPDSSRSVRISYAFEHFLNNYWWKSNYLFPRERWEYDRFPHFLDISGRFPLGQSLSIGIELGRLMRTEKRVSRAEDEHFIARYRRTLSGDRLRLTIRGIGGERWEGYLAAGGKWAKISHHPVPGEEEVVPETVRRRECWLRPSLDIPLTSRWRFSLLAEYRERREENQNATAPGGRYLYMAVSRSWQGSLSWRAHSRLHLDFGFARNRFSGSPVTDPDWNPLVREDHHRSENRLFVALEMLVGGVRLRLIESIELDDEDYRVVAIHDKGFVQLLAIF